jgi:hypothetical protein
LATAKQIAEMLGRKVDFAVMPYYANLVPLLEEQVYIDRAFAIPSWHRTHSNYGDQPWLPPGSDTGGGRFMVIPSGTAGGAVEYEKAWHLTYRGHPGISAPSMPLIDFIAYQQGIKLQPPVLPFLDITAKVHELEMPLTWINFASGKFLDVVNEGRLVTYAFNDQYQVEKKQFFESLWKESLDQKSPLEFLDLNVADWRTAAWAVKHAICHVGCRSAAWVLATGMATPSITFEPHPSRHKSGHLGAVFSCPYAETLGLEFAVPFGMPPSEGGRAAFSVCMKWHDFYETARRSDATISSAPGS